MMPESTPIRTWVDVRPHPTVVRLADLEGAEAAWLSESFLITSEIEGHLNAVRAMLERARGCGVFLIGQYGSGKSHFLAYLIQQLRSQRIGAPEVAPISLLNFSAANRLEDVLSGALAIEVGSGDRRPAWDAMLARHPSGVLLVIDELSEFLRSKADTRLFNEDVRFLQYLGEWAQGQRFWVIAAMQEGIEHTGELEYGLYRKIKDRYPVRLLLTPAHLQSLIADNILVKKPSYREAVDRLIRDLRAGLAELPVDYPKLAAIYPLHPGTLELLEEVRDRFSQARGIVDFVVTRLRGDAARGVAPMLDQPWGSVVTPDAIVDHFRDLLELQPEFLPLAQQVFPWYQRHLGELFDRPALRGLAERLIKLLVLVYIAPAREGLTALEATSWLLFSPTRVDPDRNVRMVEKALSKLASAGRYVAEEHGVYRLNLKDDGSAAFEEQLRREMAELRGQDEPILEALTPLLPEQSFSPFRLPREQWQHRRVLWQFHERHFAVWFGEETPTACGTLGLCLRLPWGGAQSVTGLFTLIPARIEVSEDLVELAALARLRERPLTPEALKRLEQRLAARIAPFEKAVRNAWLEAYLMTPEGRREIPPRLEERSTVDGWLAALALWVLRRSYPAFERYAPRHGPLPKEAWLRYMRFAVEEPEGYEADEYVQLIREAYLVPMGLLRRKGRDYAVAGNLDQNELVRLVMPLTEHTPSPKTVHEHLANPIYGLVPDQSNALLIFLLLQGEIDILKDRKSYRECFQALPNPLQYDRVVPGHALSAEQLRALQQLCAALGIRTPKQWTVLAQRRSAEQLRELGRRRAQQLQTLGARLAALAEGQAFLQGLNAHIARWQSLDQGDDPLQGLIQFLFEVGSATGFLEEAKRFESMIERIPHLAGELERFRHLFEYPGFGNWRERASEDGVSRIGEPPGFERIEALEAWLKQAAALYEGCKREYQERHQAWWQAVSEHPAWQWQPPGVAASRHLALGETLVLLQECRGEARRLRCRGLVNLDYQPLCSCGFGAETTPIQGALDRFDSLKKEIEARLALFFRQQEVKGRMREWQRQGYETSPETFAYLSAERPFPEVRDVGLLDEYLAGLEVMEEIDEALVLEVLRQRVWEPRELLAAIERQLQRHGASRLRFTRGSAREGVPPEVVLWCAEQALRHTVPLPKGLSREALGLIAESLRPEWVSPDALSELDALGFDASGTERILEWLLDGHLPLPEEISSASSALVAVRELLRPCAVASPEDLASLSENLYREHMRFMRLARTRWLARLDAMADTPLPPLPALARVLEGHREDQWVVLDALGLPLSNAVEPAIRAAFEAWRPPGRTFAQVGEVTTTDACYRQLLDADLNHAFEKRNVIDALLHKDFMPFASLAALAATEVQLACKGLLQRLDPSRGLMIFADHGFRIRPDGTGYCHGGKSTLERVVPVWYFPGHSTHV